MSLYQSDTFHVTLDGHKVIDKYLNTAGALLHVFITRVEFLDKKSESRFVFEPTTTDIGHLVIDPSTGKGKFDLPTVWKEIAPYDFNLQYLEIAITLHWVALPI